jgi:cobalamin synthase
MLLWSNLHGGYLLGLAVIGISAAADGLAGRSTRSSRASAAVALLLSGCNPAGFSALIIYPALRISGMGRLMGITEENSLLTWVSLSSSLRLVPALTTLLLLSLGTLLPRFRAFAREHPDLLALYVLSLYAGALIARFAIFFVVVATIVFAVNAALLQRTSSRRAGAFSGDTAHGLLQAATGVVLIALTAQQAGAAARTSAFRHGFAFRHPYEGVADFLERSGLTGNLFNEYGAGGYFAWRLSPTLKVFIYGRVLSGKLLGLYGDLLLSPTGARGGSPSYQEVFEAHDVEAVVLPSCNETSGIILPLTVRVARDSGWTLLYSDATAVVLARTSRVPPGLLAAAPPPSALYDNMIAMAERAGRTGHGRAMPAWRYSLAFALYAKGDRAGALAVLDEYLRLVPEHVAARRIRERISTEIGAAAGTPPPAWVDEGAGEPR